jgi:hypothetical protein
LIETLEEKIKRFKEYIDYHKYEEYLCIAEKDDEEKADYHRKKIESFTKRLNEIKKEGIKNGN